MTRPEAGDRVVVDGDLGQVLKATVGPEGQPFAIIDFGTVTRAVHNNHISDIRKAQHNRR